MTDIVFSRTDGQLGQFDVRYVDPTADVALLHRWLTHHKSAFWLMQEASLADVARQFEDIAASQHHGAYLGLYDSQPAFLMEQYDPAHEEVGHFYELKQGDVGMHFLVAPTNAPVHGFTRAVIVTVMELLFSDPSVRRVVVEPDVRNEAVHKLNADVGFRVQDVVSLRDKDALLSVCTRDQYDTTRRALTAEGESGR